MVAGGMETEDDFGAGRFFQAHALRADGYAAIGAGFENGAEAPNKGPPRAAWGLAQDRALGPASAVPSLLRGHAQFAMGFLGVVMEPQLVDVRVGLRDLRDVFAGKIGRLPKAVWEYGDRSPRQPPARRERTSSRSPFQHFSFQHFIWNFCFLLSKFLLLPFSNYANRELTKCRNKE